MYSIDTNIFLDWWERRYPFDVFPAVRVQIENLVVSGKWNAAERVSDELQSVGSAGLKAWAKAHKSQFRPHDAVTLAEANAILRRFPGLIDPNSPYDEADRYVIALAKVNNWIVVTHETPAHNKKKPPRSHYIPDVCGVLGVSCIQLVELMRRERWCF